MTTISSNKNGFTLLETLIALTVGVTLLALVLAVYVLTLTTTQNSEDRSELSQNSRVIIERLTRDLRQTRQIATNLPTVANDPDLPPAAEIEVQDGHNAGQLQYLRYYQMGSDLKRQVREYYFASDPQILVTYNAKDDFGNGAAVRTVADNLVGQYVNSIKFYGRDLINIELTLKKNAVKHVTKTTIYVRNL